jgi:hypothetical protein
LPPTAHAIGEWDREKFLPALFALYEAGACVDEALGTAMLLDDVNAAGICVSFDRMRDELLVFMMLL